jgi:hypothetical protein
MQGIDKGNQGDHDAGKRNFEEIKIKVETLELTTGYRRALETETGGLHMLLQVASGHSADRWKWTMNGDHGHDEKKGESERTGNVLADPAILLRDVDDI